MGELRRFLPRHLVGVCAGDKAGTLVAAVAAVTLGADDNLVLSFPKRNPFHAGELVTVHLDDRSGSEVYSVELRVHRTSYRGRVTASEGNEAWVEAIDFDLIHGSRSVARFRRPGYVPSADRRSLVALTESPLKSVALVDDHEASNKLGVLVTRSADRPHATVMAFLNSTDDDIFLITQRDTYKYQNLEKNPRCAFALDHRATFLFERQVDWNYTIFDAVAHRVDPSRPLFRAIQAEFIAKNPWEEPFFSHPLVEMVHLVPQRIFQQDILCD
jgi:hypothetical protein